MVNTPRVQQAAHGRSLTTAGVGLALLALCACGTTVPGASARTLGQGALSQPTGNEGGLPAPGVTPDGSVLPGGFASQQDGGTSGSGAVAGGAVGGSGPIDVASSGDSTGSAPAGGAATSSRPISVGLIAADFTKLVKSVGGQTSGSDPHTVNRAMVRALNAHGGYAGRKIEPVYYTVDGTATDYSAQEQAACEAFTRDHHVEVVIGSGVGGETLYACLLKARVPMVTGNPTESVDTTTLRAFPNVFNVPGLAQDRQAAAFVEQSTRTQWLTSKNKVGVLLSGCPWGTRAYDNIVVPRLRRLDVKVQKFSLGCPPTGSGQLGSYSSAVQNAVLQFRGAGVDRVMILAGNGDASAYVLFTSNAESQGYRPGYVVGTNAVAQAWYAQGVVSKQQAANTRGAGWVPVIDMAKAPMSSQARACLAFARSGGAPPPPNAEGQYGLICDVFFSLREAYARSGGVGGLAALSSAFESLGSSYVGAGGINGAIRLGPGKHDGAHLVAPFGFVSGCNCFRYLAGPQPVA